MNALALKHICLEGPAMLGAFFRQRGWNIEEVNLDRGEFPNKSAEEYDLILILGGPMGVNEEDKYPFLAPEIEYIKKSLKTEVPIVGICLGAQLIAKALGAPVYKNRAVEIGWYEIYLTDAALSDPVLKGLPERFYAFHWHGDTFDLPKNAVLLASSRLCKNQIVRFKPNVYGFQCHFELDDVSIREWLIGYEEEIRSLKTIISPEKILSDTKVIFPEYKNISSRLFENLLQRLSKDKR